MAEKKELPCALWGKPCSEVVADTGCNMWGEITKVRQLLAPGLITPQQEIIENKCKLEIIYETTAAATQQNTKIIKDLQHIIAIFEPTDLSKLIQGGQG